MAKFEADSEVKASMRRAKFEVDADPIHNRQEQGTYQTIDA